ncbi:MAG TPA: M48 family peptidase, partial [Candidatus Latescibacteria bacterium]|nr:M48 family peptidase [Candidatus Latescibacterota bacterium]
MTIVSALRGISPVRLPSIIYGLPTAADLEPKGFVEYVLHHELTHLEHLNHSGRFWSSFTRVLPGCRELRREMRSLNP